MKTEGVRYVPLVLCSMRGCEEVIVVADLKAAPGDVRLVLRGRGSSIVRVMPDGALCIDVQCSRGHYSHLDTCDLRSMAENRPYRN